MEERKGGERERERESEGRGDVATSRVGKNRSNWSLIGDPEALRKMRRKEEKSH